MDIVYYGHSSFRLKGKTAALITDPFDEKCGMFPRDAEADLVTVSHGHGDHNQVGSVGGQPFVIDAPGEYEVKGVSILGVPTWHDESRGAERGANIVYVIEMDGLRLAHLGDLGHKLLPEQLAEIGSIDILLVPVGGYYTIDAKTAVEVVKQVDPWVVIPMHFQQPGLSAEVFGRLAGVEEFIKEMGVANPQKTVKYSVSAEKLPTELQVVVLERK